jgi:hypothetical protein
VGASATLRPSSIAVAPGEEASCEVTVRSTGNIVDEFSFEILGDPAPWTTVEPPTLSLYPGTEGTAVVRFRPPKQPSTRAGPTTFGVKEQPTEDVEGSVVEEGTVDVGRFNETSAELIPRTSRGRFSARHDLAVDNRGNARLNAEITAVDPDELLSLDVEPPGLVADPGTATFARVRARPRKRFLRGTPQTRPFKVTVQPEGDKPVTVDGSMLQDPLIPKWLPKALAALVALVLAWFLLVKPTIDSSAKRAVKAALPPSAAPAPTPPGPAPTGSPSPPPTPVPASKAAPVSGRLAADGQTTFTVPSGRTMSVTDLVLENPQGDFGVLRIRRNDNVLLVVRLENFRDLDYHFVSPVQVGPNRSLILDVTCENDQHDIAADCTAAVFFAGTIRAA